jgi:hypothetical protein
MSIAFLILNHRPPPQLIRLLTTLRRGLPDAAICVHHDRFRAEVSPETVSAVGDVHLLTSDKPMRWGGFSIVEAYWRSIEWMTANLEFDWIVVLSGQDYPIKPLRQLAGHLAMSEADAVLNAVPIDTLPDAGDRRDRRRRYLYQYRASDPGPHEGSLAAYLRLRLQRGAGRLIDVLNLAQPLFKIYRMPDGISYRFGWRVLSSPFGPSYPCWHGSNWFGLSRRAADFVVDAMRSRPDYVDYYRKAIIPSESIFATLICNEPTLRVRQSGLHHIRWAKRETGHPDVFTVADLAELRQSPEYFARKFDIYRDSAILDRLDEIVFNAQPVPDPGGPEAGVSHSTALPACG